MTDIAAAPNIESLRDELRQYGETLLKSAQKTASDQGVVADVALREAVGVTPAKVIVEEASQSGCNAIVMGTHGRIGVSRLLLGSDASMVVVNSKVPVLLVRLDEKPS